MSGDYSDGEGCVRHEADFVDATADMEVDLCLPLEVDMPPDQLRDYVPTYSGAVDPSAVDLCQEERRRFEPPNGPNLNGPDMDCHFLSLQNPLVRCRGLQCIR